MTETQKRIRAYKRALPELRERVIAVALLLAMSTSMLASASFAWLTISRHPEVTGVSTTVAANGNLEIALVGLDGKQPAESAVGDSSAVKGRSVTAANTTWGNLVNLSDSSYGLEYLTLRPAQLNTASLLESPLYGAVYTKDGRIDQLSSNFGYTIWNPPTDDKPGYFGVSDNYGVRAISSTKIEAVGAAAKYYDMLDAVRSLNLGAATAYVNLGNNNKYMPSLATMMGLYMTARMNPSDASLSNPDCAIADIQNLRDMYGAFLEAFDQETEAIAALLNLQMFLKHGEGNYEAYTSDRVLVTTDAELRAAGLQITRLNEFLKDRNTVASDWEKLKTICDSGTSLKWKDSGLNDIVNNLVNVGACTIGADNTPISSIGASNAMGYLSGTQEARITNGILYRFEERTGGYIEVKNLGISATVKRSGITVPATVRANIQTTAPREYNIFNNDQLYTEGLNDGNYKGGSAVAKDTYGLAIDLWVRTNAKDSYLILEGNVLTESEDIRATGEDANGNPVELFVWNQTMEEEDGSTISVATDVYKVVVKENDGTETTTWHNADNHTVITAEELNGVVPTAKMVTVHHVIGYEGENRIWTENEQLSTDSTTQGSGSCYVYYADTPEDQARSLKLLESFKVAFVNQVGRLLCTANMDTSRYFAENGRVIVPLVLNTSDSINLGEDYKGDFTYAITELEQNMATRITAIVYLDGTKLTNKEVLAASDIQGQLNIQFGSSEKLNAVTNEELELQECKVTASVDNTSFDYMTSTGPMKTNVTLTVDGAEPTTVTAFFMRSISSTQGSREETMTFTKGTGNQWVSSYTFTSPGKYVLRTVQLDGVEYTLSNETPPTVNISGFSVESLVYTDGFTENSSNRVSVRTADNSYSVNMSLRFALGADAEGQVDESKLPKSVQGRFIHTEDQSAVNVDFRMGSNYTWTGMATFISSGEYTMEYLILDGEYMELEPGLQKSADIILGMKVAVYTTSPHSFKYVPSEMADNEKLLGMQVMVMDNNGDEMPGMSGLKLTYGMKGSGIKTMDADLTWNGRFYVGELPTAGPGIWQFSNVIVGTNILTIATDAPKFTILSPEPPEYYGHDTTAYQYRPNNDAKMNVQITNSGAATVQAYIIKAGAAEGVWVNGTISGEFTSSDGKTVNNWSFNVPTDANGYQDGNWTMTELRLWDVFAADGTAYTEEAPLVMDISDENNVTKVVNRIYPIFTENKSQNFTGSFLQSHTISGLDVNIKDIGGAAVPGVSEVQLIFTYQNSSSESYGGYNSTGLTNATQGATVTVNLTQDGNDATHFVQTQDATILYAGEYATTLSFKVSGTKYTYRGAMDDPNSRTKALPANAPVFTVSSAKPTVKVTGTSPAPGTTYRVYTVKEPTMAEHAVQGDFFRYTDYTAAVYIYTPAKGGGYDQEAAHAYAPSVSLKLSNVPAGYDSATMTFTTANADSVSSTFTFDSNYTATATIGRTVDGSESWTGVSTYPKSYPAGKMTQNKLVIKYGDMTYDVTLSDAITIDQPQSPTVMMFTGIPVTFTGTKPEQIVGNGTTVTVTLPNLTWTANTEEASANAVWSAYTSAGSTGNYRVYTIAERTSGGWIKTNYKDYQYYDWTKFQSSCTDEIKYYSQDMQILGWKINGNVYPAGQTISITADGIINAEAVVTEAGAKVLTDTQTTTAYRYLYGYVTGTKDVTTKVGSNYYIGGNILNGVYSPDSAATVKNTAPSLAVPSSQSNMTDDPDGYLNFAP